MYEKTKAILVKYQKLDKKLQEDFKAEVKKIQTECTHKGHWIQTVDEDRDRRYLVNYCVICGKTLSKIHIPETIQKEINSKVDDLVEAILSANNADQLEANSDV